MMEKTARQLVDSAPVENEKGKQRGPIFVCQHIVFKDQNG